MTVTATAPARTAAAAARTTATLLVGVDGTEAGRDALALARALAAPAAARIVLVCGVPVPSFPMFGEELRTAAAVAASEQMLARAAAPLTAAGHRVEVRAVPCVGVAGLLHRLADELRPAIVVLGSRRGGSPGHVEPGAVGRRLLHGAPCAVALAPTGYARRPDPGMRRVGVAFDGTAEACAALLTGHALAVAAGARLELVQVARHPDRVLPGARAAHAALPAPAVPLRHRVLTGEPGARLAGHSRTLDLLVLGSRSHGSPGAVLLGGVAQRVVRTARCPVLVTPRPADHQPSRGDTMPDTAASTPADPVAADAAPARRIVVGVDGSPRARVATKVARRFAEAAGASLVVAAVSRPDFYGVPDFTPDVPRQQTEARGWIDEADDVLAGFTAWEPQVIEASSAARGLQAVVEQEGADLLVLGHTHRGQMTSAALGTVGRRLLHGATCPILVAGPSSTWPAPPRTVPAVGIAYDGSPESAAALRAAAAWAHALGAGLHVYSVVELPGPGHPAFGTPSLQDAVATTVERTERHLAAALRDVDVPAGGDTYVLTGDPVDLLAEASHDVDLLVVGSRGYGPVRAVMLGGVSARLIERAASAVLVVPRGAGADAA
jgi:nucleotide-binding universal stress UspA family protein